MGYLFITIFLVGVICVSFCLGIPFGYFFKEYNEKQQKWIKRKLKNLNKTDEVS